MKPENADTRHGSAEDLSLLGLSQHEYPTSPEEADLQCIPWHPRQGVTTVTLLCPEFTALCPKTGQPDFAAIEITYQPRERLVESKSLKFYLFSFRQRGDFHETVVDRIGSDLVKLLDPVWLRVHGKFLPRGGISIWPVYEYHASTP